MNKSEVDSLKSLVVWCTDDAAGASAPGREVNIRQLEGMIRSHLVPVSSSASSSSVAAADADAVADAAVVPASRGMLCGN